MSSSWPCTVIAFKALTEPRPQNYSILEACRIVEDMAFDKEG